MSSGGVGPGMTKQEYYRRRKLSSCFLRREFLRECLEEQVLPRCAPRQLSDGDTPFSESARAYLREACDSLSYRIEELRGQGTANALPPRMLEELQAEECGQRRGLARKLEELCNNSKWNQAGRADLVRNLSGVQLSQTELQALSLGLKFDSGSPRLGFKDFLNKNCRWGERDVDQGFKQGIVTCYQALAEEERCGLPRRFRKALEGLSKRSDLKILPADKGGGVVVMKREAYVNKMLELLNDADTYRKVDEGFAAREAAIFKKEARRILSCSARGKKLLCLLEEAPRPPRMRGLPKVHKPGVPMRPITSGIGSAPHRLAKRLAKPLSAAMGTVSSAHLRNSTDLIQRIKGMDVSRKKLASFDVKALFTNVPVEGALETVRKVVENVSEDMLPIEKEGYIELVSLCVKFGCFTFDSQEYVQHRGLAMGSPLSAVMASLFMESLEEEEFVRIMGRGSAWFRYVDDVLVIVNQNTNIENKLRRLNGVNSDIQFTVEEETEGKLPFLDTLIHRVDGELRFSVYRKPTNKDDYIHFLSQHDTRTKSGVVIGFFLRALRICSEEYLQSECDHIVEVFRRLMYPLGLLRRLQRKAESIWARSVDQGPNAVRGEGRGEVGDCVIVPYAKATEPITRFLARNGVKVVNSSGRKIRDYIARGEGGDVKNMDSVVYRIPCGGCPAAYYGETSRGVEKRISEHKGDLRHHRTTNSMVIHAEVYDHLPEWNSTEILHSGLERRTRKMVEAAYISTERSINHKEGFCRLAHTSAKLVIASTKRALGNLAAGGRQVSVTQQSFQRPPLPTLPGG